jgi:hypothetical protein
MTLREQLSRLNSNPFEPNALPLLIKETVWSEDLVKQIPPKQIYGVIFKTSERRIDAIRRTRSANVRLFQKPDIISGNPALPSRAMMNALYSFLTTEAWDATTGEKPPIVSVNDDEDVNPRGNKGGYSVRLELASPLISPRETLDKPLHLEATIGYTMYYTLW